jgi:imidazolonepropionase-like amidohydrolase
MQRRFAIAALVVVSACGGSKRPSAQKLAPGDIALVGATVLPMDRETPLVGHTVVVRGDKIAMIAPSATLDTKDAQVIDAKGKWIVPGLADMHVHTWGERDFAMYLLNGVTTVRDMFGSPQQLAWREQIMRGQIDGPTLILAGPIVDGDPPTWPGSAVVTTPDAAKTVVQEQKRAGYDLIKVYGGLTPSVYEALAAEAKAQNIPFAGHVPTAVGVDKAIASGQRSIEHLDGYVPFGGDDHVSPEVIEKTAKGTTWNCPTLVVTERFAHLDDPASLANTAGLQYVSAAIRDRWDPKNDFRLKDWTPERFAAQREKNSVRRKLVGDLNKAGARIVVGTDTGNPYVVPGFAVHDELGLLVTAGLTPYQALRAATFAPSELAGTPGAFGAIAVGARADLIVVDADPLQNLATLATPSLVIVRGKPHERAALLAVVEKKPVDAFAKLPAITEEGTRIATARYDISLNGNVLGRERAVISKLADGAPVVRGQAVYETPSVVIQYRATRDTIELVDGPSLTRNGTKVVAKLTDGKTLEAPAAADAVLAPQSVAEFVWYAEKLAEVKVGDAKKFTAVALMVDNTVHLDPVEVSFTRKSDAEGRRVFDIAGSYGGMPVTGTFALDADGSPNAIELKLKWGTFLTKRVE